MVESLASAAATRGIPLSSDRLELFALYYRMLVDASRRMNLVGNVAEEAVVNRHFVESIVLGAMLREREILRPGARVLDLGTGAGFPGIPIRIMLPAIQLTLVEATEKKAEFLTTLVEHLQLEDVIVEASRAELLAHDDRYRGSFDVVLARAVAPLSVLCELSLPFLRIGGRLVTPKGERAGQEIADATRALEKLGGKTYTIPFAVAEPSQVLVLVVKTRDTPAKYPRRPGIPEKRPL